MDILLLKALCERQRFRSLRPIVPDATMAPDTVALLGWMQAYYNAFAHRETLDLPEFQSFIRTAFPATATKEQLEITLHLVSQLEKPVPKESVDALCAKLYEKELAGRMAATIMRYEAGEEVDLAFEINGMVTQAMRSINASTPLTYEDTPIHEILADVSNDRGIKFRRIEALRTHIAALQGGASIAIAARPDKGKTSFIADTLTDMAPQCVEFFGVDRPILWFNNEGTAKRIVPRIYQAAGHWTLQEVMAMSNEEPNGAKLYREYTKRIGAPADYIRVKDMHGASMAQAEQVIEAMRPCIVVWDMLANFRGGSVAGENKASEVEWKWQQKRELAVRYDFISMATVQISAGGDNQLHPPYTFLKDSQTGIQGATDIILMIGSLNNPDAQTMRGFSTPKNKFAVTGKPSNCLSTAVFHGDRCMFDDGGSAVGKD